MAAAALPIALLLGILAELVSGLLRWPLGGERAWWRGVTGIWPDLRRLLAGRSEDRASVVEAGAAIAAMLGAGAAAAGGLGIAPGDLPLLYLFLALGAAAGFAVSPVGRRAERVLAELAFAVALGTLFLRYGTFDLDAIRGTQTVLGVGVLLGPTLAAVGMVLAVLVLAFSGAARLATRPAEAGAGGAALASLCRWSLSGATSLVAAVPLAGGELADGLVPLALGALAVAALLGVADALVSRLSGSWRWVAAAAQPVVAAGAATMAVVA